MTQAGLSGMVRELEAQLGARLFDRTTRTVALTETGAVLLPVATDVLDKLDSVAQELGTMGSSARGSLTVGTTPMLSAVVMPRVIEDFAQRHPGIVLKVRDLARLEIQGHVESRRLDAGFGVFLKAAADVHREKIGTLSLFLAGPASSPLPPRIAWKELRSKPLIALSLDNPVQKTIEDHLARSGREGGDCTRFNSFTTLLAMVEAGLGFAIVPSFARLSHFRVNYAVLTTPRVNLDFFQVTKKGTPAHPALADFSHTLTGVLARLPNDA